METKRCTHCHKLSRMDAESCSRCGHVYVTKATMLPVNKTRQRGSAALASVHDDSSNGELPLVATRRRSIPPASPHRAGHYSGLHPEDQPYQSTFMAVQRPQAVTTTRTVVVQHEPTRILLPKVDEVPSAADPHLQASAVTQRPLPVLHQPRPPRRRVYFVPFVLTIACLILLIATSLLAYISLNKRPVVVRQALNVLPGQLRVNDTFTLSGSGFGVGDPITFTHDKNIPLLNGNQKPLQTRADTTGTFIVQVIVPGDWQVGQHPIYAFDIGKNQSISVMALLTVLGPSSAPPLLQLSSTTLDLGSNAPGVIAKKNITLINGGGKQLSWQASSDQPWLVVSPSSGTFSGRTEIAVTANSGQLKPQSYLGHITFRQGTDNQSVTLTVTMSIKAAPPASLLISPVALTYSGTSTQSPAAQTITLQNNAGSPLNWSTDIGNSASWLSLSPASDQLAPHASESVTVSVNSLQLAVGSYQSTITFKGGVNPQVAVALNVAAPGNLVVSPPALNFSSTGQSSLTIQNSGGEAVDWTVTATTVDGAHWLTPTPANGLLAPHQAATVTVSVNTTNLQPHSYQGTLTFSYSGTTSSVAVALTVSVPPAPSISINSRSLSFSTIKGTNPVPQSFTITNTGNATLNWAVTEDQVAATYAPIMPASGSLAPAKSTVIVVSPNVLQANGGVLNGALTISDSDSGSKVPSQNIGITIVVNDQARITLTTNVMTFNHDSSVTTSSQILDIINSGSQTLNWAAQSSASWLTADIMSGSVSPAADAVIEVDCDSNTLAPGTYTATLVISDTDPQTPVAPQTLTVTLVVT